MARYRALYEGGKKIYEEEDGVVLIDERNQTNDAGYYVMGDIQPYQSMIDGSYIESRSKHRQHLKAHGCIEVGNEKQQVKAPTPPAGRKEALMRAAYQHGLIK